MSDAILGHDVNGEALRAGDRVKVVVALFQPSKKGKISFVTGPGNIFAAFRDSVELDDFYNARPFQLIRLQSGRDVFEKARDRALSQGSPDAQRSEPTTTERAQAWISGQPWAD